MTETRKGLFEPVQHQIKTCSVEDIDEELERKYGEKGIKYIVREGEDLEKWKDEIREENKEQKLTRDKEQILREQRKEILPGPVGQEEMAKHIAIKPSKKQKRSVREG